MKATTLRKRDRIIQQKEVIKQTFHFNLTRQSYTFIYRPAESSSFMKSMFLVVIFSLKH